ncbi:hypothetical protein M9H77_23651 [Catharanthus roseus]|uniref:Uncharacterized protein n=1 Tax=Catharanthus roseus TaxID=4058 RepID=A0ACC0AY14_CATRO|nr:hypothetical protein M9H77_23651 [Catharanthus roseus]
MERGGGGPLEKMQHDRKVRSTAEDSRIYHDHHPRSIFILFPAWEGGSKKGSLLLSWTEGSLHSGRPSYQNAFLVEDPFTRHFLLYTLLSKSKAKGETASLSFGSSFAFPRNAVVGAKPAFFTLQMREKVRGENTFSLYEIQKWRTHSILWVHRIKHKAALSWQSFRRQEILGLVGASEHNKSKPKMDQGSLLAKPIGEGTKD